MPARKAPDTPTDRRRAILTHIAAHPAHPLKPRALARELHIPNAEYSTFRELLRELLADGTLVLGPGRTLRLPEQAHRLTGVFRASPQGYGFLERPGQPDLYIPRTATNGALDGDTVLARLSRPRGPRLGPRAEVVRVVQRAPLNWVGVLEHGGDNWFVQPQGRLPLPRVRIADPAGARAGELVVVQPDEPTLATSRVRGRIIARLGDPDDGRARIQAVIRRMALPDDFPADVRTAAQAAADAFDPALLRERRDLRSLLTVTIDPADARDFDDAISLEVLPDARVRLGVHIADVAHFVPPSGPVDREAHRRGTSVYFPNCVLPMLPESLSNGACSLQPNQPRLTNSVFITYDKTADVVATEFAKSIICSAARLTYDQVTALLNNRPAGIAPQAQTLLRRAEGLALRIHQRRLAAGMIALTLPEVEIRLDERGRVLAAGPADTSFSHTIIEMFMVAANEAVARGLRALGVDGLRRVHPPPEPAAAESLAPLAPLLSERPPRVLDRASIRHLLERARGRPEEPIVSYVLLRSLSQACYSPAAEGHFALASDDYCHFTSPIRRYPDLTIHRLFDLLVRGERPRRGRRAAADREHQAEADLAELGRWTSAAERRAQQAQREAVHALLLLLMKSKVGQVFDAAVTGVASVGAFVQLQPHMAEGLLHVADFGGDDWDFDRRTGTFLGRRTGRVVHLGQRLRVQVAAVDELRQELVLVRADRSPLGTSPGERTPPRRSARAGSRRGRRG